MRSSLGDPTLLLSMTGHGEAHRHQQGLAVGVEVRTVNNRYFKLSVRASEGYGSLESQIESVVREHVRRGTVQVSLKIDRLASADDYRISEAVLLGYMQQLDRMREEEKIPLQTIGVESLLILPGVVQEKGTDFAASDTLWPEIEPVLRGALKHLSQMRTAEGDAMTADLSANLRTIATELAAIEVRAPLVIEGYRTRIQDRLNKLLAEYGVTIQAADVVREVGMFAERTDISEEVVRLRSHLEQFELVMLGEENPGRKLDFLTQEMFREVNTIGSKANDGEIARRVIEIKSIIERIREMVQNVE